MDNFLYGGPFQDTIKLSDLGLAVRVPARGWVKGTLALGVTRAKWGEASRVRHPTCPQRCWHGSATPRRRMCGPSPPQCYLDESSGPCGCLEGM